MNSRAVLRLVLGNPRLRRAVLAFAAFNLADWARWLSVLIYAFGRGGATEAGAVSLAQLVPAALVAPLAASLGDRYPRDRVLLLSYVAQATLMLSTAAAVLAGAPSLIVYALAVLGACSITLTRPAHGALLPWLARTPAELTAANAASGTMEGLGILAGQAAAGIVLQLAGPGIALAAAASVASVAAVLAGSVVTLGVDARPGSAAGSDARPRSMGSLIGELNGGIVAVVRLHEPRTIVLLLGSAALVWGALDVLVVVLALDVMGAGESGVGFLNALTGVGALLGAAIALSLAGRLRLAVPFVAGLLVWGLPIAGIGLLPVPLAASALLVLAGAGRSVMDVVGRTLLQRSTPDAVLSRVLGVVEGIFMGAFGIGSIAVPVLIGLVGPRQALVAAGLFLPVAAIVAWRSLAAIDRSAIVPLRELALLRAIPMFAPLAPPVLERLASHLQPLRLPAGEIVIRQGDPGDRFYVLVTGEVDVSVDDRPVRTEGPGAAFGEIALLLDVPRTATVRARTHVELLALGREVFLAAVTGVAESRLAAGRIVEERFRAAPD